MSYTSLSINNKWQAFWYHMRLSKRQGQMNLFQRVLWAWRWARTFYSD